MIRPICYSLYEIISCLERKVLAQQINSRNTLFDWYWSINFKSSITFFCTIPCKHI